MHKFVLQIFKILKDIEHLVILICLFLMMMMCLYWIQNLIHVTWSWLGFITPVLDSVISFTSVFSGDNSFFEYFFPILFFSILIFLAKFLHRGVEIAEDLYDDAYRAYKKEHEKQFNKQLVNKVYKEEKELTKYMFYVQVRVKQRLLANKLLKTIDLEGQKNLVNKFITDSISVSSSANYLNGFLYYMNDFNRVDSVIDILYKLRNISDIFDYVCCVQIGNDLVQMNKLIELQSWGKITMCADTLLRYNYNDTHRYKTNSAGVFQNNTQTIEVHEFIKTDDDKKVQ